MGRFSDLSTLERKKGRFADLAEPAGGRFTDLAQPERLDFNLPTFADPSAPPAGFVPTMPVAQKPKIDESILAKVREDIATIGEAAKIYIKEGEPYPGEIQDRLKNMITRAISPLAYVMPGVTRKDLIADLNKEAEKFTGFGPAIVPAAGEVTELAAEWIAFQKAFGVIHKGVEAVKGVPKVTRILNAIEKSGGVRQFAEKFPRIFKASEGALQAFLEGGILGTTYGALEGVEEGDILKRMAVKGATIGGIAATFSLVSSIDNARYIGKLRKALVANTRSRYSAKIKALPKGMADPRARTLITQENLELQQIDNIVSATEAQLIGMKSGKLARGAFEAVESPQKAAQRIIKYGYKPGKGYAVGQPQLKKGMGKAPKKPLIPSGKVAQAKEYLGEIRQVAKQTAQEIRGVKGAPKIKVPPKRPPLAPAVAPVAEKPAEGIKVPPKAAGAVKKPYYNYEAAKRLVTINPKIRSDAQLQKDKVKLLDYHRVLSRQQPDSLKTLVEGGFMVPVADPSASGFSPKDAWLQQNITTSLDSVRAEIKSREAPVPAAKPSPAVEKKPIQERIAEAEEEVDETGGISTRRRNRLAKEAETDIEQSDIYQVALAAQEAAPIELGFYYVPEKFRSEVEDIIGKRKGFPTKLQRMFTFSPTEGAIDWTKAVQEQLGRGKTGVDETWGEMDISDFVQSVKEALEGKDKIGRLNAVAVEKAKESGDPWLDYKITKLEMLHRGYPAQEIDDMTAEFAEGYGLSLEIFDAEWIGPEPLKVKQIKQIRDEAKQNKAIETLARENVLKQERQEAKEAVNDILRKNDLKVEVKEVEEITEEPPFERRAGRPTAATITTADQQIVLLAFGADSATGYHEGYHVLRRRLTPKDITVLDKIFKGDEEAEATAFADFAKTGKARSILRGIWQKLINLLKKVKSSLQGRGFRTVYDIFGEIQTGRVAKEGLRPGAVRYEKGVFGQPIQRQLFLPLSQRKAVIKRVEAQEKTEKARAKKPSREELEPTFEVYGNYVLNASAGDLKKLRASKTASYLWPVIDELRPEIKAKPGKKTAGKPYEYWRPRGRVKIKAKLIKAVDQIIAKNTKKNVVKITPEQIAEKFAALYEPELFYNPVNPSPEIQEAFNQLVKGGPLFDIRYEIPTEKLIRDTERRARVKAEKARLKQMVTKKRKKMPGLRRIKIKINDTTPFLREDLKPLEVPPPAEPPRGSREPPYFSDAWYRENIKKQKQDRMRKLKSAGRRAFLTGEKILSSSSTRLYNISPELFRQTRRYIYDVLNRTAVMVDDIDPFLKGAKKMSRVDHKQLDLALKNSDKRKITELVVKYKLQNEYGEAREVLDEIFDAAKEVGIDIEYHREYWHRHIKDSQGFLEYFQGREDWSIIEEAIKRRAQQAGRKIEDLTDDEKAQVINTLLRGFRTQALILARPGAAKERTVDAVWRDIDQFYDDYATSIMKYIKLMNAKIAEREFFGRETKEIQNLRKLQSSRLTRLIKLKRREGLRPGTTMPEYKEHISKTMESWKADNERLERLTNRSPKDTIGGYVYDLVRQGQISPIQEKQVQDILNGIFAPKGMRRGMGLASTAIYLDTLNSPLQALTQLDEFAYAFYRSPLRSIPVAIRTAFRRSKIEPKDIGIRTIGMEFQGPSMKRTLTLLLKSTGFELVDRLNKENYINTILSKYQAQARSRKESPALAKRLAGVFGKDYKEVLEDLRKPIKSLDDVSDNVKYLLFNEILNIQPITVTEMPEAYNKAGNLRILYTLKTFYIKRLDFIRKECFEDMKSPKTFLRGFSKLVWLAFSFALFGAVSDFLKDWLKGRAFDLTDSIVDNMLRMVMSSKFQVTQASKEGAGRAVLEQWVPPTKVIDEISKDVMTIAKDKDRGFEIWRSVPLGGELYYWWFGRGREKIEKKEEESW